MFAVFFSFLPERHGAFQMRKATTAGCLWHHMTGRGVGASLQARYLPVNAQSQIRNGTKSSTALMNISRLSTHLERMSMHSSTVKKKKAFIYILYFI